MQCPEVEGYEANKLEKRLWCSPAMWEKWDTMSSLPSKPPGMVYVKVGERERRGAGGGPEEGYNSVHVVWNKKKLKSLATREKLQEILSSFGVVTHIFISHTSHIAYASFQDTSSAERAVESLHEKPCPLLNRKILKVGYARLVTEEEFMVIESLVECTSETEHVVLPGITLSLDYFTEEEERDLIADIDRAPYVAQLHRRVQHYGYKFDYKTKDIMKDSPLGGLPSMFNHLIGKVEKDGILPYILPDQVTVNEYEPGQGIGHHCDSHSSFYDGVAILSLGSGAVMSFRNSNGSRKSIFLPARSLLYMEGEARYGWEHAIPTRKMDVVNGVVHNRTRRLSVTMRKVRMDPCTCPWPSMCDSQFDKLAKESIAPTALEMEHVHKVYNTIAHHFSNTRYAPWPKVEAFVASQPPGTIIADIGCGNGKYLSGVSKSCFGFGSDRSEKLIDICRSRGFESLVADALKLPYRDCSCDVAMAIAVAHHLSTPGHRLRLVQELGRVTRVGGQILIYAWALEQEKDSKRRFEEQDVMVPWNLQKPYVEEERDIVTEAQPVARDEDRNSIVYQRFCHVYCTGELETLVGKVNGLVVEESYFDTSNWAVRVRKVK